MLKKLSLAALVAMGSMSVASAATPLEQAIKNVSLSGMLRVRFYNEDTDGKATYNRWRTNAIFIFNVPVAENISFVVRNSVQTNVYTNKTKLNPAGTTSSNVDDSIVNNLLFMKYTNNDFGLILGKIPVATSITSADPAAPGHGAGAIATYKVNDQLTVAGAFVDALKNPGNNTGLASLNVIGNDIYAAAAFFNIQNVKGNVWYYHATNLVDNIVTLTLDGTLPDVEGLSLHADYAVGKLDSKTGLNTSAHQYYNISAKYQYDAFCGQLGYAKANKKGEIVELSVDAPIGAVIPTANNYNIANLKDTSSLYAKVGYAVDPKTNVYVAYQHQNAGSNAANPNNDLNEYTIGGGYKMTKKLSFSAYYDIADWDDKASNPDNNEFRFEAKYSF
jgi:hypothetical protein